MSDVPAPTERVSGAIDHECPACNGAGWCHPLLADQPTHPSVARDILCQQCHGTGRVHDADAEHLLAMYASIDPPYAAPALKAPTATDPGEQLYHVTFDALPATRFRVMARNATHAVLRIKTACHLSAHELRYFSAQLVF